MFVAAWLVVCTVVKRLEEMVTGHPCAIDGGGVMRSGGGDLELSGTVQREPDQCVTWGLQGSLSVIVVPWPGWLSSLMVPPCASST